MKTTFEELCEHIKTTEARQPLDPFALESIKWLCRRLDEMRASAVFAEGEKDMAAAASADRDRSDDCADVETREPGTLLLAGSES
jgi:uncharacterized protein YdaU (DUF1376 family)